eukprot:Hpha_TRINITY_DN16646_c0_g6::TRINITY_DN16646_c0_g6_i1::g.179535::m.179535
MTVTKDISMDERAGRKSCHDGPPKRDALSVFYEPHPDVQTRDAYYSGMPPPRPKRRGLEKPEKQQPHKGFVARANSLAEFEVTALQPNAKGVAWDRGAHRLADEMAHWVSTQEEDRYESYATENLLVAPLSESHHKECGDKKCRDLPVSGPDDVREACTRLVAKLPAAFREAVRADAEALAALMTRLCPKASRLVMQLEIVGRNRCARWHQDNYVGRAIITYAGPGTWIVDDRVVSFDQFAATEGAPEAVSDPRIVPCYHCIQMPPTNSITLMKGSCWPGMPHGLGLTHKSPNMKLDSRGNPVCKRLILKVDLSNR